MKKIAFIVFIVGWLYSFTGCVYDKRDVDNPNGCDTTNMSYSKNIAPIISVNCTSCHSASAAAVGAGGGIGLDSYATLKADIDSAWLLPAVNWQLNLLPSSYSATGLPAENMPQGLPQLGSCNLNKINAWVHQGAKNN